MVLRESQMARGGGREGRGGGREESWEGGRELTNSERRAEVLDNDEAIATAAVPTAGGRGVGRPVAALFVSFAMETGALE